MPEWEGQVYAQTLGNARVHLGPITLLMAAFNCTYIRIFRSA